MSDYPDVDLGEEASAALEALLRQYVTAVEELLVAAALDEPIVYLCLDPGQEEGLDTLPVIFAGRRADRDRLVSERSGHWPSVWDPYAMHDEEDVVHPTYDQNGRPSYVSLGPEAAEAWDTVHHALDGRCLSPEFWVHRRAARMLNDRALPLPATEDFAVWVFDHDDGDPELLDMLRSVLPPDRFERLRRSGVIRDDEGQ